MELLRDQIRSDIKDAMKQKEVFRRDTLRLLSSAMKQIEVDERKELSNEDVIKIIQKQIKQREESAKQYSEAGREDLAEKENGEADIFRAYLPKQLSDSELEEKIREIANRIGAKSMADMGKMMGTATKELAGVADGKRINIAVKTVLS
ncbi:hypothetical protein ThvES_00006720 [Thiovulum sp. ES]|nr:hypothetical protein ThvES_00006720 [Thiovulum sp. ES]